MLFSGESQEVSKFTLASASFGGDGGCQNSSQAAEKKNFNHNFWVVGIRMLFLVLLQHF